jgi:alpha-1,2-mannosyltransferase
VTAKVAWRVAAVVLLVGAIVAATRVTSTLERSRSFDFDINWVAAHRLVEQRPLYDPVASRAEAERLVGRRMQIAYSTPFSSYIGLPAVALAHVPLTPFDHDTALALFRIASVFAMLGALALVGRVLPAGWRGAGFAFGAGALLLCEPALWTLGIGQGNAFVMLGLALAMWGSARGQWRTAGIGCGAAAVLKASPALLLVYLALRGQWRAVRWGAATVVVSSMAAAAVGRPSDLVTWVARVMPDVSAGSLYTGNQSLVGWVGRLIAHTDDLASTTVLGPVHYLGIVLAAAGVVALWSTRRSASATFDPLELGAVVLVVLVAGPLSWDHYFVWALLPLVLMVDPRRWRGRTTASCRALALAMGAAIVLLLPHVSVPDARAVGADWTLRLTTTPYALSALLLLGCAFVLVREPVPAEAGQQLAPAPAT